MNRKIEVTAHGVRITATITTNGEGLSRNDVERIRDQLADRLVNAATGLLYIGTPLSRVKVR
jgi:hypothetical protein